MCLIANIGKSNMDLIPKLLKERMHNVLTIATCVEKYMEVVKDIVSGINPAAYVKCIESIAELKTHAEIIPNLVNNDAPSMSAVYQKIIDLDASIDILMQMLNNETYSKLAFHNMSPTYVMGLRQNKNIALDAFDKYIEMAVIDDEVIFDAVFNSIKLSTNPDSAVAFIVKNENVVNKFMIKLIGAVIKIVTGDRRRRLELIIENQKNIVLGASRKDISKWGGVQGLIVRYNLRPMTASMPLPDLFAQLGLKYNAKLTPDENFAANAISHGIIVTNISTKSPIEFSLQGLIDMSYISANDMKTNPLSGLTKKIIDRFNTARELPRGGSAKPITKYPAKNKSSWYVFQTINGDLYRIMGKDSLTVTSDQIHGMLSGLSTRAHMYNELHSSDILSRCFDPKGQLILSLYQDEKQIVSSSGPIKTSIVDQLTIWFEQELKKTIPKSLSELKSMAINVDVITTVLLDLLTHSTGIHGKGSSEYLITYIAKFDSAIWRFIKELERKWNNENMSDRMFKERTGDDLVKYLLTIYTVVVKAAADELDAVRTWTDYDISIKEYFLEHKQAIV